MSEWQDYKVQEIALRMADAPFGSNIKNDDYTNDGAVVVQGKNIQGRNCVWNDVRYVSNEKYLSLKRHHASLDALVFPKVGTIGKVGILTKNGDRENYLLSTNTMMLIPDPSKADIRYVYYFFSSNEVRSHINAISSNSVQPVFNFTSLKNYNIPLPQLQTQKTIASVLSSLDDKIDLLHRQNTTLERMAETLFRQWFIEEAQDDWEEVQITKLFDVRDGTHDSPKQKAIGKPLITSKHINGNCLDFESAYLISDEDFDKINQRSKVDKNDILISMIGTIGLIYLEQSDEVNYAIKNVGLFKTSQNSDWMAYTYFWLKSNLGRQFLDEHTSGSTQEYVSLGSFRSILFRKPTIEKLEEFNKIANGYLHKIKNNSIQIQTLKKLRDNLLSKLMSGEVRVEA